MANRSIDYYIKNLSTDVRQEIFNLLREVNPSIVQKLLEKEEGYPSWKSMGIKDDEIQMMLAASTAKFYSINKLMVANKRPPLFAKSKDTYGCAQKYVDLLKEKTEEELNQEFGCSWEEYVPAKYEIKASNAPSRE